MKIKILTCFLLFGLFFKIQAQEDIRLVKIDNSNYPDIEVFIRSKTGINPNEISIIENNKKIKIKADTIPARDVYKGRSILFVIPNRLSEKMSEALKNVIVSLEKNDEINIGIINESIDKSGIYYLSPEYSNNRLYFSGCVTQSYIKQMSEIMNLENCRTARMIEKLMSENSDPDKNKAIIQINTSINSVNRDCSDILKKNYPPIYSLELNINPISAQKEMIDLCTQSGGIYTICKEEEIEKFLHNYLEDIKYSKGNTKTNVYRIAFKTEQNKSKNYFSLQYKKFINQYIFTKPQRKVLNKREQIFLSIAVLLFILLIISILNKQITGRKGKNVTNSKNKTSLNPLFSPIEINLRIKGFNKTYFFEKHIISIGRSSGNDIIIPDRTVSGNHAVINKEGNDYMIQDLGSTNGVIVNQRKVKKIKLQSKDKIKLGGAILVVRI
jgi:hypothetical protein